MRLIDADALKKKVQVLSYDDMGGETWHVVEEKDIDEALTVSSVSGWVEITSRQLTDEEREDFDDDVTYVFTCELPDDEEEVLITNYRGNVCTDYFIRDGNICYFEEHPDIDEVVAWCRFPEPFKKGGDQK